MAKDPNGSGHSTSWSNQINPKPALLFALMAGLTVSAGYYKKSVSKEQTGFAIEMTDQFDMDAVNKTKPVVLDLAQQGVPKRMFQPDRLNLSTGHSGGVVNKGKAPVHVQFVATGFRDQVVMKSDEKDYDLATHKILHPIRPNESTSLTLDVQLSRREDGYLVDSGMIQIVDYETGHKLAAVPIRIVNSKQPVKEIIPTETKPHCDLHS